MGENVEVKALCNPPVVAHSSLVIRHSSLATLAAPHVLGMASINNGYSLSIESVGKVPFVGVCHCITNPTLQGRIAT